MIVDDNSQWIYNIITLTTEVDSHCVRRGEFITKHRMKMKRTVCAATSVNGHSLQSKKKNSNQSISIYQPTVKICNKLLISFVIRNHSEL